MNKLLLHVCCAPCSAYLMKKLTDDFEVIVFYYNPNIHPEAEYQKRYFYAKNLAEKYGLPFVEESYNHEEWQEKTTGLESEPEGGKRCPVCFSLRLAKAAAKAKELGCGWFASSLTSGKNKKPEIINPLGDLWAKRFGVKFLSGDWKKNGYQEEAKKIVEQENIYRQNYCGCEFSLPKE